MIETRKNLLGSCAIGCDGKDCRMEHVAIDEPTATAQALLAGWTINGCDAKCPDCMVGNKPAQAAKPQHPVPAQAPPQLPESTETGDYVADPDEDDDDDGASWQDQIQIGSKGDDSEATTEALSEAFQDGKFDVKDLILPDKDAPPPEKPFNYQDTGDTIEGLTAKAEDVETAEDRLKREKREKRQRELQEASRKETTSSTRAKMGGVADMLKDFDGAFGSNNTWDGD